MVIDDVVIENCAQPILCQQPAGFVTTIRRAEVRSDNGVSGFAIKCDVGSCDVDLLHVTGLDSGNGAGVGGSPILLANGGTCKVGRIVRGTEQFVPTDIPGCMIYDDAYLGAIAGVGGIATWTDQSYTGNDMTQANAALQPTLVTNGFPNGGPAIDLPGVGGHQFISSPDIEFSTWTFVFVVKANAPTAYLAVIKQDGGGDGAYLYTDAAGSIHIQKNAVVSDRQVGAAWLQDNAAHLVIWSFDGTNQGNRLFKDAAELVLANITGNNPGTGTIISGKLYIGGNQGGGGALTARLAAFVAYNRPLTAAERAKILKWSQVNFGTP